MTLARELMSCPRFDACDFEIAGHYNFLIYPLGPGRFVSDLFLRSPMTSWVFLRQLSRELVAQCLGQVEFGKLPAPL
jgi:hypothetical protein